MAAAGALALVVGVASAAGARAGEARVTEPTLVVELGPPPASLDVGRLRRALGVYLQDMPHEFARAQPPPGPAGPRSLAVTLAAQRSMPFVAWWSCAESAEDLTFSAGAVKVAGPASDSLPVTATFKKPVDSGFYRVAALKLRGVLRAAMRLAPEPLEMPGSAPTETSGSVPTVRAPPAPSVSRSGLAVELVSACTATADLRAPQLAFGGRISWEARRWAVGVGAAQSLSQTRRASTGAGATSATRVTAGTRYRVARSRGRLFLAGELEGGVVFVRTRTSLAGPDPQPRSISRALPLAAAGLFGGLVLATRWELLLGARVDIYPQHTRFLVQGEEVFSSGWVQPGLFLAGKARF